MALDTSIYQNIQRPQIDTPNPLDSLTKAMALSKLGLENKQLQLQAGDQSATRNAISNNVGEDGMPNYTNAISDLFKGGNAAAGMALQQQRAQQEAQQAEAKNKIINDHIQQVGLVAHLASSAKDQDTLNNAYGYAEKLGLDTSSLPKEWNDQTKDVLKRMETSALDQKTRLEALAKQSEVGINEAKAPLDRAHTIAETRKANAETNKTVAETPKQIDLSKLTPDMDPATLVRSVVPKEQQPQAFKEIDAAKDTKRMAGSILDAFDQAAKDTSGLGTVESMAKTPRSTMALHQALQPTFRDLEGTVRQSAMDNTFTNVTPRWNDSQADLQTKRAALVKYLQSKASSSTAMGSGIDLNKFDSTRPYENAPKGGSDADIAKGLVKKSSQAAGKPEPHPQDAVAVQWAKANPRDPLAAQILQLNGVN